MQVLLQNKKALLIRGGTPMYAGHRWSPESCGHAGRVSAGALSGPGPPHTGVLFRAALPCSGEFIYICIYHPITGPILIKTAISCNRTGLQ